MLAIDLRTVTRRYPDGGTVLDGVDLQVEVGQFCALTGASGCGKTTLLNIIGAVDRADGGHVEVLGVDYARADDDTLSGTRRRIGYVFQSFFLSPGRTALENVLLALAFGDRTLADEQDAARQSLEAVGLTAWADRPAGVLSGGQRQRVALARALAARPELILADEPVGQLDADTRDQMIGLLADYRTTRGATVLVVTHESELVAQADRTLHLTGGHLAPR